MVTHYINALQKSQQGIKILVGGDFIDDPASEAFEPLMALQAYPLKADSHTYIYNGHAGQLDYFFSQVYDRKNTKVNLAHINAQYTNRASDHNPILFDFELPKH